MATNSVSGEVTTTKGYRLYRYHQMQYATVYGVAPDGMHIEVNTQYESILGDPPAGACWPLGARDHRWDEDADHIIAAARQLLRATQPIERAQAERLAEKHQEALSVERRIERRARQLGIELPPAVRY